MVITAVISARTMKRYATKAQQVVLAAAIFDNQGRILVSPEGLLPSEKITETFPQRVRPARPRAQASFPVYAKVLTGHPLDAR